MTGMDNTDNKPNAPVLFSKEALKMAYEAGRTYGSMRFEPNIALTFDEWFAEYTKPPHPPEPGIGTILMGSFGDVWTRKDDIWHRTGTRGTYTWKDAIANGADPDRVLVVKPSQPEPEISVTVPARPRFVAGRWT